MIDCSSLVLGHIYIIKNLNFWGHSFLGYGVHNFVFLIASLFEEVQLFFLPKGAAALTRYLFQHLPKKGNKHPCTSVASALRTWGLFRSILLLRTAPQAPLSGWGYSQHGTTSWYQFTLLSCSHSVHTRHHGWTWWALLTLLFISPSSESYRVIWANS